MVRAIPLALVWDFLIDVGLAIAVYLAALALLARRAGWARSRLATRGLSPSP